MSGYTKFVTFPLTQILSKIYRKKAKEMGVVLPDEQTISENIPEQIQSYSLRLVEKLPQTHDSVSFRFVKNNTRVFSFKPGQFGNFTFVIRGKAITRSYSFSASPNQKDFIEITVKREPGGLVSNWMIDHLAVGDTVEMKGPLGTFTLPPYGAPLPPKKLLLIGAGSGITPLISMAKWIVDQQFETNVILIYSMRTRNDCIFRQTLYDLASKCSNLRVCINYTRENNIPININDENDIALGRLSMTLLKRWVPDLTRRHVYMCGPDLFMQQIQDKLQHLGLAKRKLYLEYFSKALDMDAFSDIGQFNIHFTRSNIKAESIPAKSILDVAEQHGMDVSFSCRSGTCGECKTRKLSGDIHMLCDDGLTSAEKQNNYILTCTALPLSDCKLEM